MNLDVAPDLTAVRFESQSLTTAQKEQARTNIGAQATLTFDNTPTASSTNPVTSDGIKTALDGKVSISGGNASETVATATGSTTARTLANRFADVVNVKDFIGSDKPLVLVVAGQSNAVGSSATSSSIVEKNAKYWNASTSKWVDGVADPVYPSQTGGFCPALAQSLVSERNRPVYIINVAVSASVVGASNTVRDADHNWSSTGNLRTRASGIISSALGAISGSYDVLGTVWLQGESDAYDIYQGDETLSDYSTGIASVLSWIYSTVGGKIFVIPIASSPVSAWQTSYDNVNSALKTAVDANSNAVWTTDATLGFKDNGWIQSDNLHYTQAGYDYLGNVIGRFVAGYIDVADDVQNALLASTGKILLFDGTFLIGKHSLEIPSNTHMVGTSGTRLVRGFNTGSTGHNVLAYLIPLTGEESFHDVTIEGIIFDGNGDEFGSVSFNTLGWSGYPAHNIVIRDCEFHDIIDYHAIDVDWTDGLLVENCKFKGWKKLYSSDTTATRREMIQLQGTITNTFQNKNIVIKDCWFGASDTTGFGAPPTGIGNHGWFDSSDVIKDIMIVNNTFEGCTFYGVTVYGWQNVLIDGNNFLNCQALGLQSRIATAEVEDTDHDAVVKNIKFINNTCRRDTKTSNAIVSWIPSGYASVASRYSDITSIYPQDILIANNVFDNYNSATNLVVFKNVQIIHNWCRETAINAFIGRNINISKNCIVKGYVWTADTSGSFTSTDYPITSDCGKDVFINYNFFYDFRNNSIVINHARTNVEITGNNAVNVSNTSGANTALISVHSDSMFVSVHDNTIVDPKNIRNTPITVTQGNTYKVYGNRYYKNGAVSNPYKNTVTESYIPSSGATSEIKLNGSNNEVVGVDPDGDTILGGTSVGGFLRLYSSTDTNNPSGFQVRAGNTSSTPVYLVGKADGTLTWNGQSIQTTSDERLKTTLSSVPDAVLDAWGDVNWGQFQYLDAVERKGESARLHLGLIAQRVKSAFEARGLDACTYGILCHEVREAMDWDVEVVDTPARTETVVVVDKPAVFAEDGALIEPPEEHFEEREIPAITHIEQRHEDAVDLWMVRYNEAQAMEIAYQRRRADRIEAALESVADRMATLERKVELIAGR